MFYCVQRYEKFCIYIFVFYTFFIFFIAFA